MLHFLAAMLAAALIGCSGGRDDTTFGTGDTDIDTDTDSDTDSDTDTDTDTAVHWDANALGVDFEAAILDGQLVDGAKFAGQLFPASFAVTVIEAYGNSPKSCTVYYRIAGADPSPHFTYPYWAGWDVGDLPIHDTEGDCETLDSVFGISVNDDLEGLLAAFEFGVGIEPLDALNSATYSDWSSGWSGTWTEDRPYLAVTGLYNALFSPTGGNSVFEINVMRAWEMDPVTLEIASDTSGTHLVGIPLDTTSVLVDGFYQSVPMYLISTGG